MATSDIIFDVNEDLKQKMLAFMQKHTLAVISTIHSDRTAPESAVVGFTEREDLSVIIGTSNTTRKYQNMKANPHVALVIGWDPTHGTLQLEGEGQELTAEEAKEASMRMVKKNPFSEKFVSNADQRYFLITPTWIRFTDNAGSPPEKYEIKLM